ncbi:13564_t:CDS:2 [Acaulospora morrowiae]|uniref:13564_t:CDS:1 n=1 Tax=Acaulospora morrowiae TaxID=94023 RepID=A0A9N8V7W4_9GLOM|nr:13564_t:CDS:2 [Acaulospora morrowiae]
MSSSEYNEQETAQENLADEVSEANNRENALTEDDIFEELEKDDDFAIASFREQRMKQLKREMTELQELHQKGHGSYTEISSEKEVIEITTSTKLCVVHYFHKEFRRCQIMDKHLTTIANRHFKTKFVKINVENAPFLVEKLAIKVLPCVMCLVDGIVVDRIVGFEELGNTDSFTTEALELRLSRSGVVSLPEDPKKQERKTIFGFSEGNEDDDDDWD